MSWTWLCRTLGHRWLIAGVRTVFGDTPHPIDLWTERCSRCGKERETINGDQ